MGFWLFMMIMLLVIPLTMIIFGKVFLSSPPQELNSLCGYRTNMSMKNKDTWEFAHRYFGRLWYRFGWYSLLTLLPAVFLIGESEETVGLYFTVIIIFQTGMLVGCIFPTERALKRNFNQEGQRINS